MSAEATIKLISKRIRQTVPERMIGFMEEMTIKFKRLSESAIAPTRGTVGSAGLDLYTNNERDVWIMPMETEVIGTGLATEIPFGCVGLVFPRSGLSTKEGIVLANCVAVIDSDYRGEIKVPLKNLSDEPRHIVPSQRVAQLVIMPYKAVALEEVDELEDTTRGVGGFGSTGK